jgi:hypothetical protein
MSSFLVGMHGKNSKNFEGTNNKITNEHCGFDILFEEKKHTDDDELIEMKTIPNFILKEKELKDLLKILMMIL